MIGILLVIASASRALAFHDDDSSAAAICGNGIVEGSEQCDTGDRLGSPDCSPACRHIDFEPPGLPFVSPIPESTEDEEIGVARILSPRLQCKPSEVRDGARNSGPVHVRYRIHLCRTSHGVDSFTPQQVRAVMSEAAAQFAQGGIILEEESLVRFTDNDCDLPLGDKTWSDALVANTPPGVLAMSFVLGITNPASGYGVGGFCQFFGPFCVNAGVYDTLVVHELGHFFGLAHTFECAYGIETPETCADSGDMICDTPADRGPLGVHAIAECNGDTLINGSCTGSCGAKHCTDGSKPDGYNWMSYFDCTPGHFSNEQFDFMRCTLDYEMSGYNAYPPTTTSTSTTLPEFECGDVNGDGDVTAGDALNVLRASVGMFVCELWQCDFDGSGAVSSSDALKVLKTAVGSPMTAHCPLKS